MINPLDQNNKMDSVPTVQPVTIHWKFTRISKLSSLDLQEFGQMAYFFFYICLFCTYSPHPALGCFLCWYFLRICEQWIIFLSQPNFNSNLNWVDVTWILLCIIIPLLLRSRFHQELKTGHLMVELRINDLGFLPSTKPNQTNRTIILNQIYNVVTIIQIGTIWWFFTFFPWMKPYNFMPVFSCS